MSRTPTIATLEAKKLDLQAQIKQIDGAIRAAKEKEQAAKQKAIVAALAERGLLDQPLEKLLEALGKVGQSANPATPAPPNAEPPKAPSFGSQSINN